MKIELYSDGSGNTFDSEGGYGWRIVVDGVPVKDGSGYLPKATNNVAEITAAIAGLEEVKKLYPNLNVQNGDSIELVADSQLVLGYASGAYTCKALHLLPLYLKLRSIYKELNCTQRWVKGHNKDTHNEACDQLAKTARQSKGA